MLRNHAGRGSTVYEDALTDVRHTVHGTGNQGVRKATLSREGPSTTYAGRLFAHFDNG